MSIALLIAGLAVQEPACAFDTAAHLETRSLLLGLAPGWRVNLGDSANRPPPPDYVAAARVIQAYFVRPEQVRLPFWARTVRREPEADWFESTSDVAGYGLDGHVRFRLTNDGHLTNDRVEVTSSSPDIVAAVTRAIHRADGAGAFTRPSGDLRRERGAIVLHFVNADPTGRGDVPLMRVSISAVAVDSAPQLLEMPPPVYPENALLSNLSDRVLLKVVIGADGRPDTTRVELIQANHREFVFAALSVIAQGRFRPATTAGCPLPVSVILPFNFRIR